MREKRVLSGEEVRKCLSVLETRERLIVKLAIFSGLRPGEIFGLKWSHVHDRHVDIVQRIYRGKLDTPKSKKSVRKAAISPTVIEEFMRWRSISVLDGPDNWVFPSESGATAYSKDNCWHRHIAPRFKSVGLRWANFQVMRRTIPTKARETGEDPKVIADQLGHGLGVSLEVYTQTSAAQREEAVKRLEGQILQ